MAVYLALKEEGPGKDGYNIAQRIPTEFGELTVA